MKTEKHSNLLVNYSCFYLQFVNKKRSMKPNKIFIFLKSTQSSVQGKHLIKNLNQSREYR